MDMADAVAVADTTTTDTTGAEAHAGEQGELKKLIAQRDELKRKLREVEPLAARAKELEQAQMTEQQKMAARIAELEPVATKAARMETVVSALLEQELAGVPEDMRDVVPNIAPEEKLDWLRQAKAKGLFAVAVTPAVQPTNSPIPKRPAGAGGQTMKRAVFETMNAAAQMEHLRKGGSVTD